MKKSIARKLAGLLAAVVLTSTFASDYNSIGARASEVTEITEEIPVAEGETEEVANEEAPAEEDAPASEEVTNEEESAPVEETVEVVEETPAEVEAPATEEAVESTEDTATEENAAAGEGSTEETAEGADEAATEETADATEETPADDAATEATDDAAATDAIAETPAEVPVEAVAETAEEEERVKVFAASKEIDGILVSLYADPEVLPDDAVLDIQKVSASEEEEIKEMLDEKTGDDVEVTETFTYDINIYSESYDGYVQPEDGTVEVRFSKIEQAADEDTDLAVYHVSDDNGSAEKVAEVTDSTSEEISFNAEHFSKYAVTLKVKKNKFESYYATFNIKVVDENYYEIGNAQTSLGLQTEEISKDEILAKITPENYEFVSFTDGSKEIDVQSFKAIKVKGSYKAHYVDSNNNATALSSRSYIYALFKKVPQELDLSATVNYHNGDAQKPDTAQWKDADQNAKYAYSVKSFDELADETFTAPENCTFGGWTKDSSADVDAKTVTSFDVVNGETVELYAVWVPDEADYTINIFEGAHGKYQKKPLATFKSTDETTYVMLRNKTVKEYFGKAYIGKKFVPNIEEELTTDDDYVLDRETAGNELYPNRLELETVDADSTKNVINVYYNTTSLEAKVCFYVLNPGEVIPASSIPQDVKKYFPSKDSNDVTYDRWSGLAIDLYSLDKELDAETYSKLESYIDEYGNLWDPNMTGVVNNVIKALPDSTTVNGDLAKYLSSIKIKDDNGKERAAELSDIHWYVYKNVNMNGGKAYHIDGFIQNIDVTVTYYANYPGCEDKKVINNVRTGSDYEVLSYEDTLLPERENYKFVGWTSDPEGKLGRIDEDGNVTTNPYEAGDVVTPVAKTVFYAQWVAIDTEFEVVADSDSKPYNGEKQNSTTATCKKLGSLADNYDITAEASVGVDGIKDVKENSADNKKVTKITLVNKKTNATYVLTNIKTKEGYIDDADVTLDGEAVTFDAFMNATLIKTIKVVDGTFEITKKVVDLQSDDLEKQFDGTALTNADRKRLKNTDELLLVEEGWVNNEGAIYEFTGSQIEVGKSANSFEIKELKEGTDLDNYFIKKVEGTLEVTHRDEKFEITIKLSAEKDELGTDTYVYYSGVEQKANMNVDVFVNADIIKNAAKNLGLLGALKNGIDDVLGSMLGGMKLTASAEENPEKIVLDPVVENVTDDIYVTVSGLYLTGGRGTAVGDYPIYLHSKDLAIVLTMNGKEYDIRDEFKLTIVKENGTTKTSGPETLNAETTTTEDPTEVIGYLHVLKRDVVLTSGSASKVYDGTPLTEKTVTASEVGEKTGFVNGEGANFNVTGTITNPGTVANTFTYTLYDGTVEGQTKTDMGNYNITTVEGTLTVTDETNVPDNDDKKKKKKHEDPDNNDSKVPNDNVDDDPDEGGSTPQKSVLGEKRAPEAPAEAPGVLGARRGGTEDETNTARVLVLLFAAGAAASLMAVGRKKKEDNE